MGAFSADALISEVFGQHKLDVDFDWFAGKPAETNRLNRLRGSGFSLTAEYARRLHQDLEVPWYGQRWNLRFYPSAWFYGHSLRRQAWLVAIAGSTLTGALTLLVFVQANGRRRAERLALDLDESRENLRIASQARSQLSRELHDGTIQSLYAIGLALRLGNRSGTLPQEVTRRLLDIGSQLDQVITDLRRYLVSSSQESASVKPQTLAAGLEELARRWKLTHPIDFQIMVDPLAEPPIATSFGSLLQLTQEAISNAVRHGAASRIEIAAKSDGGALVLTVVDHGSGFDPERLQERTEGGIANMRQRATAMGATLRLVSQVGGPTTITVLLPNDSREPKS
jgi:signal transduction histidine kinase